MTRLVAGVPSALAVALAAACSVAPPPPSAPAPAPEPRVVTRVDTVYLPAPAPETPVPEPPERPLVLPPRVPPPQLETTAAAERLRARVAQIIEAAPLDRVHWGIEVYDPRSDRVLVSVQPDKHFIPASNQKLLVTAAALALLGPEWRYTTSVRVLGPGAEAGAGEVDGLLVEGAGDPTFSERFHPSELAALDTIAARVAAAGVRRVAGDVVVDASRFEARLVNPSWEVGDLDWYYAAPVAAFGAAEGAFRVRIAPGPAAGTPARIEALAPAGLVTVLSRATTAAAGQPAGLALRRLPGDTLVFTGAVALGAQPDTDWVAVVDPADYAARALLRALRSRGVEVAGRARVVYDRREAAALLAGRPARLVAELRSPPMRRIAQAVLEPSQNWIAETLVKTLGARPPTPAAAGQGVGAGTRGADVAPIGGWTTGLAVVERFLTDEVGIDSLALRLRDGSGLSAQNLVTPRALTRLLTYAAGQPWGEAYLDALAAPGEEDSTMQRRLLAYRGRVFAKTGTIANVNTLSGYLVTDGGRELVFSILTNGSGLPASTVRRAIDRIVVAVAES